MDWFRRNLGVFILGVVGLFFVASVLFPIFVVRTDYGSRGSSCRSNLKQIGLAFLQYSQDYDEKMPPVASSGVTYGWTDAVYPYIKSTQLFQCPNESSAQQVDPKLTGYTDYFFNAQLQKRDVKGIGEVTQIIVAADGNDGHENTDARYAKTAIPAAWRADANSPSFRHFKGRANYLFADGHVKALDVKQISMNWQSGGYYFQPKLP